MVIMIIMIIFIIILVVMWFYKLVCDILLYKRWIINLGDDRDELCMLFCFFGLWNINFMMKMVEIIGGEDYKNFWVYVFYLVEYLECLFII